MHLQSKQSVAGLSFVGLEVSDLNRSKTFYEDILGFVSVPAQRPDAVIMKTDDGLGAFALKAPSEAGPKPTSSIALWFCCDDIDALAERAQQVGAEVVIPPQMGPFGRMTAIADPDGHTLTFHNA